MEFTDIEVLTRHLLESEYPKEMIVKAIFDMSVVETCIKNGADNTSLVILDSEVTAKSLLKTRGIDIDMTEEDEIFSDDKGTWRHRIYILDDWGNGIVLFTRVRNGGKNGAEADKTGESCNEK